jgi:RimJ/RimL family protein N-acetyltransferase
VDHKIIPVFKTKLPRIIKTADSSLVLRLISLKDLKDFHQLGLDRDVAKFNNYYIHDIEDAKKKIISFLYEINRLERFSYSIVKNNNFVGYYGIWRENNNPNYFREGVAILPEFRRQGIYTLCSEALVQVLLPLYKQINLVDNVDSSNTASIAASKSRGFKIEGFNEIGELRFVKKII